MKMVVSLHRAEIIKSRLEPNMAAGFITILLLFSYIGWFGIGLVPFGVCIPICCIKTRKIIKIAAFCLLGINKAKQILLILSLFLMRYLV